MRPVLGVLAGFVVWTALWLGGGAAVAALHPEETGAFEAGGALTAPAPLVESLLLALLCSLAAGFTTARIARERARGALIVVALLLLAVGIGVQVSVWERMPVAYHLAFLLPLVPVTMAGGRARRPATPAA
jgi:hypothetical protein